MFKKIKEMIEKREEEKEMERYRNKLGMYKTIWEMSGLSEETMKRFLINYTGKDMIDEVKAI